MATHQENNEQQKEFTSINFAQKFTLFKETWSPKIIAEMNDYQFKVARLRGEFVWHSHADTDETFIILDGEVRIHFRDGSVLIKEGEMYVVPKGKEHKPEVEGGKEAKVLLIEPRGVVNTGDGAENERTALKGVWI